MVDTTERRRRSIRLHGYDYSTPGAYFVTICTQHKQSFLGAVVDNQMRLNDPGQMVDRWWKELENKFPSVQTDEYIVMPNHFHGIVMISGLEGTEAPRLVPTLGAILDWFKTMTTNEYIRGVKQQGWQPFSGRVWQRNYCEHVIRNEVAMDRIREYIVMTPQNWRFDNNNPDHNSTDDFLASLHFL